MTSSPRLLDLWRAEDGTLMVAGDVAGEHEPGLRALMIQEARRGPLVLDLSEVKYLPRIALAAIIAARRDPTAHQLEVRARAGSIAGRVLETTGMTHTKTP